MRAWIRRLSPFAFPIIAFGCATEPGRTYYDDLDGGDAGTMPDGSGGGDVGTPPSDSSSNGDTGVPDEGTPPPEGGPDAVAEAGGDAEAETGTGVEAGPDSGPDAPPDTGSGPDAAVEAGCGPTNTAQNCGSCGTACGNLHVMASGASCVSGECQYNCASGYSNCTMTGANTTGCECHTPGCCSNGCQTTHATGLSNLSYYDCNPLATASQSQSTLISQALAACAAFNGGSVTNCTSDLTCSRTTIGPYVCNANGGTACTTCWSYGGTDILKTENCSCPTGSNPPTIIGTWN